MIVRYLFLLENFMLFRLLVDHESPAMEKSNNKKKEGGCFVFSENFIFEIEDN